MAQDKPLLSIIIPAYNARASIGNCLDSLRRQTTTQQHEILVVDSSSDDTADYVARNFPEVRLLRFENRLFAGGARNRGIAASHAPVIAFLDADCTVGATWVDEIIAAHAAGHAVVASAIENGSPWSLAGWTYYLCEFNLWLPARRERTIPEAAGCCLSFHRSVFDQYGPFIEGTYCSDTAFHWKLQSAGLGVHFSPGIRVRHHTSSTLREVLEHVYVHRRYFARVKCAEKQLSRTQRLLHLLLLVAAPGLLLAAVAWRLRRWPSYIPVFVAVLPALFLSFIARALGEADGFWHTSSDH